MNVAADDLYVWLEDAGEELRSRNVEVLDLSLFKSMRSHVSHTAYWSDAWQVDEESESDDISLYSAGSGSMRTNDNIPLGDDSSSFNSPLSIAREGVLNNNGDIQLPTLSVLQSEEDELLSEWSCDVCTYQNTNFVETCAMCENRKQTPIPVTTAATAAALEGGMRSEGGLDIGTDMPMPASPAGASPYDNSSSNNACLGFWGVWEASSSENHFDLGKGGCFRATPIFR